MLTLLQTQANKYFAQENYTERFHVLSKDKQIRKYFTMLVVNKVKQPEGIIAVILEISKTRQVPWSNFLQAIWAISLNFEAESEEMSKLTQIVKHLCAKNMVSKNTLMLQLPDNLISSAGLMEQQALDKKSNRAFTKLNFEQNKYSLLRQNNQGYAKTSLLLLTLTQQNQFQNVWNTLLSLTGNFDLDPDRVLDLIIESFISKPHLAIFISLLKKFNKNSLAPLIGHKILKGTSQAQSQKLVFCGNIQSFSKSTYNDLYRQNAFIPNPKLINIIARLIKYSILQLQDIFPYLKPSNQFLQKIQTKRIAAGKHKVNKSFKMSLQQMTEQEKLKLQHEDELTFLGQLIYSSKLAVLANLIIINDWGHFAMLWRSFQHKIDFLLYQPIMNSICDLLEWVIDPIYSKYSLANLFKVKRSTCKVFIYEGMLNTVQMKQYQKANSPFWAAIHQIMQILGSSIGFNSVLLIKFCRMFKGMIKQMKKNQFNEIMQDNESFESSGRAIQKLIKENLLPGINYQKQNPAVANQIYSLLQQFDYRFRYDCYLHVYKNGITESPYSAMIFEIVKNKQNVIVNNLSKDNKKAFIKKMAKLTHNHALQVFYWIVRRLLMSDYEAVVPQIVSVLNNCTQLTLEMVMFVMIYSLVQQKAPAVLFKSNQTQPWFKNIATFVALFYRKYLETDIRPVFDYILLKLGENITDIEENNQIPGTLLKLLHHLINKMFGSLMVPQINKSKYDTIASGPRLQFQALYLSSEIRAAKKSKVNLQNFFWNSSIDYHNGNSLILNILVLMVQKRVEFLQKTYISDLKIIGDVLDQFNMTFIQLIRFLKYQSIDHLHYKKLLQEKAFSKLINVHGLPIQAAFEIVRPSVKPVSSMNNEEWSSLVFQMKQAFDIYIIAENNYYTFCNQRVKLSGYLNQYREKFTKYIPINFFTFFWYSTLDAIYFPAKFYSDKIDQIKKKIQGMLQNRKSIEKSDRQLEKLKTLFEKITKQQEQQRKKYQDMSSPQNLTKFQLQLLKGTNLDKAQVQKNISQFSQIFVQMCLIPRMTLDASQALYCAKFTIEMIRANKMSSSRSIKMLTIFIQLVLNYLPFATEREASHCLSVYLGQILGVFSNWHDQNKLKADMKKSLNIDEGMIKDNYPKLRQYLLKLFQRAGNLIKSIKQEPYIIKNCLYLLQKVDSIPGYKGQAQQLEQHLRQLKQIHTTVDMQLILDRQITIINSKKPLLVEKPNDKKMPQQTVRSVTPVRETKFEDIKQTKDTKQNKNTQKSEYQKTSRFKDVTKDNKSTHRNDFKGKTNMDAPRQSTISSKHEDLMSRLQPKNELKPSQPQPKNQQKDNKNSYEPKSNNISSQKETNTNLSKNTREPNEKHKDRVLVSQPQQKYVQKRSQKKSVQNYIPPSKVVPSQPSNQPQKREQQQKKVIEVKKAQKPQQSREEIAEKKPNNPPTQQKKSNNHTVQSQTAQNKSFVGERTDKSPTIAPKILERLGPQKQAMSEIPPQIKTYKELKEQIRLKQPNQIELKKQDQAKTTKESKQNPANNQNGKTKVEKQDLNNNKLQTKLIESNLAKETVPIEISKKDFKNRQQLNRDYKQKRFKDGKEENNDKNHSRNTGKQERSQEQESNKKVIQGRWKSNKDQSKERKSSPYDNKDRQKRKDRDSRERWDKKDFGHKKEKKDFGHIQQKRSNERKRSRSRDNKHYRK